MRQLSSYKSNNCLLTFLLQTFCPCIAVGPKKKPLPALYQSSSVKFTQLNVMSLVTTCKSDSPRLLLFEHVSCYTFGMCRIAMNPKDLTCKFHMDSYEPSTLSFSTLPIFSAMEYNVALALSDISRL